MKGVGESFYPHFVDYSIYQLTLLFRQGRGELQGDDININAEKTAASPSVINLAGARGEIGYYDHFGSLLLQQSDDSVRSQSQTATTCEVVSTHSQSMIQTYPTKRTGPEATRP